MSEYVPVIDSEVEKLLQEQFSEGYDTVTGEVFGDTNGVRTDNFFRVNQRRTQTLIDDVNNNMHVAESASLRMMDDVYRQTIYKAELAASTGSVTMEQAVDMAVKDFLSAGINCIQYKNGRMVNIATYAEMAIRTSSLRSYFRGEAQRREELRIDTVLVTQYGACSDTCLPWQGKVYIDDVWGSFNGERSGNRGKSINGSWYPLLSVAVDGGLFHPNCRHSLGTWREGIDKVPNPLDKNEVRRAAELEAKQRALERNIRKWKRLEEGSIYPEDVQAYKRKRLDAQKELREFIRENSDVLRRDYWREKTFGIPHEANKVADYENNQLKNQLESGIIITNSANVNTGKKVEYNPAYDYTIKINGYDSKIINSLSMESEYVAKEGSEKGVEILSLVDLDDGTVPFTETGDSSSVGGYDFWNFIDQHQDKKFAFIHNHPTDGFLSEGDMRTLLTNQNIKIMCAVRNDSVKYLVEKNDNSPVVKVMFDELYEDDINRINKMVKNGEITPGERAHLREETLVNNLIRDYTKGLVLLDGRK